MIPKINSYNDPYASNEITVKYRPQDLDGILCGVVFVIVPKNVSLGVEMWNNRYMKVLVLNGPNLNLLGEREPHYYGYDTLEDCADAVRKVLVSAQVDHIQTNSESEMIEAIHDARSGTDAIIINAAAFTHYSYAIRDALAMYDGIKVEVHLSNPYAREEFRHTSVISAVVTGVVAGFTKDSYALAAQAVATLLEK